MKRTQLFVSLCVLGKLPGTAAEGDAILSGANNQIIAYSSDPSTLHGDGADYSVIAGGSYNLNSASFAGILGGAKNLATANFASILGGFDNKATGRFAAVLGGAHNKASGRWSVAAGLWAKAGEDNTLALGFDAVNFNEKNPCEALGPNSVRICAEGVDIAAELRLDGDLHLTGDMIIHDTVAGTEITLDTAIGDAIGASARLAKLERDVAGNTAPARVQGCMDPTYLEYNPLAQDHSTADCVTPELGCTRYVSTSYGSGTGSKCGECPAGSGLTSTGTGGNAQACKLPPGAISTGKRMCYCHGNPTVDGKTFNCEKEGHNGYTDGGSTGSHGGVEFSFSLCEAPAEPRACVAAKVGQEAYSVRDATALVCDGHHWQPRFGCQSWPPSTGLFGVASHPKSCFEIQKMMGGQHCAPASTGRYTIQPDSSLPEVEVMCDFSFDGGGWTVWAAMNIANYASQTDSGTDHILNFAGKFGGAHAPRSYTQMESSNLALNDVLPADAWTEGFDFMLFNRDHDFYEVWESSTYDGSTIGGCESIFYPYSSDGFDTYGHHIPLGCVQHGWQGGTSTPMYHTYACNGQTSKPCDWPSHCTGCHRCIFSRAWSCDPFTTFFAIREPEARRHDSDPAQGVAMPMKISTEQALEGTRLSGVDFVRGEAKLRQCGGFSAKTITETMLEPCYKYGNGRPFHVRLCSGTSCSSLTSIGRVTFSSPSVLDSITGMCWNGYDETPSFAGQVVVGQISRLHLCSESAGGGIYEDGLRGIVIWQPACDVDQHDTCMHVNDLACSGEDCKMYWYYEP